MTQREAEHRSTLPEVVADAETYGLRFCDIDRSIKLYRQVAPGEPFDQWEWPRRIAALRLSRAGLVDHI